MASFANIARSLPITLLAFALAGLALIGLPPSGAYLAKSLLLQAASDTAQWWWTVTLQLGGILTSGYVLLVLAHAALPTAHPFMPQATVPRVRQAAALVPAVISLSLGLFPWHRYLPMSAPVHPLTVAALLSALWPILVGGVIAMLMGPWRLRFSKLPSVLLSLTNRARSLTVASATGAEEVDGALRQWPAASLAVSVLVLIFGMAMLAAH
jgi:NADH:ubiquinone oxidoreductase subunit 5 (subunit L)/multisubunit Na+/H+ antiporter MnhA subunit